MIRKRRLRSANNLAQQSSDESSFKKIWFSIIEKSSHNSFEENNNNNNKLSNNSLNRKVIKTNHDYLKPFISFYQNHKHLDYNSEVFVNKLMQQKYPMKLSSNEPDSFELTTSSFIPLTNSYTSISSLPASHYDDLTNHHKANEFYSIFVSVITAAVFLFFIMWRWFKMNSDFRKALREQLEVQQNVRQTPQPHVNEPTCNRSSRMALLPVNRWTNSYSFILPNNREELQATASHLITQLSNGEYRSARQHQQMIDRARYCLQQLKLHARLTQFQRQQNQQRRANNYSTFNQANRSSLHDCSPSTSSSLSPLSLSDHSSTSSLCPAGHDILPPVPPVSITSLQTLTSFQTNESYNNRVRNSSIYNFNNLNTFRLVNNEPPPDYESLMIKSCSLPSYSNLKDNNESKKSQEK